MESGTTEYTFLCTFMVPCILASDKKIRGTGGDGKKLARYWAGWIGVCAGLGGYGFTVCGDVWGWV